MGNKSKLTCKRLHTQTLSLLAEEHESVTLKGSKAQMAAPSCYTVLQWEIHNLCKEKAGVYFGQKQVKQPMEHPLGQAPEAARLISANALIMSNFNSPPPLQLWLA